MGQNLNFAEEAWNEDNLKDKVWSEISPDILHILCVTGGMFLEEIVKSNLNSLTANPKIILHHW